MAGPVRDLDEGTIDCKVCGIEIPDREYCTLLVPAYNNNGTAAKRRPSEEEVICAECRLMAISNPREDEFRDVDNLTEDDTTS